MKSSTGTRVGVGVDVNVGVADGATVGVDVFAIRVEEDAGEPVAAGAQPERKASKSKVVRIR
jgi:hypothetical protein